MLKIAIGIQARVQSKRLRGKTLTGLASGQAMIYFVLDKACMLQDYFKDKDEITVSLLVPTDEENIWNDTIENYNFTRSKNVNLIVGSHKNVFERYKFLQYTENPDFIVRLTGDCPIIPDFVLIETLERAIYSYFDYFSNVDPDYRTVPDGWDIEVFSAALMKYFIDNEHNLTNKEKEHVTLAMRNKLPNWARFGTIGLKDIDMSYLKYSIDEKKDFDLIQNLMELRICKKNIALTKGVSYYEYTRL